MALASRAGNPTVELLWRAWPVAVDQGGAFFLTGIAKARLLRWHRHRLSLVVGRILWDVIAVGLLAALLPYVLSRG